MEFSPGFGFTMNCYAVGVRGTLREADAEKLTSDLITAIDMRHGPGHATFRYPNEDIGFIHIRTLIESYICIDSWTPYIEGFYLFINSCKAFDPTVVNDHLEKLGFEIVSGFDVEVHL